MNWHGAEGLRPLLVPIEDLLLDEKNTRRHDKGLPELQRALTKFGQHRAAVAQLRPDGTKVVRVGNGMLMAARALGWTHLAALVIEESDEAATARSISDNALGDLSSFDDGLLADALRGLSDDLVGALGFGDDELRRLLGPVEGLTDPDEVPPPAPEPTSRPGDLWLIGPHRIAHGDARDPAAVARLMDGKKAACLWCDPPFGVRYQGGTSDALTIENDVEEGLGDLLRGAFRCATDALEPGSPFYVVHPSGALALEFHLALRDVGWRVHEGLCWVKDSLVLGHSDYHHRFEPLLYGWLPGAGRSGRGSHAGSRWHGDNAQDSVFEVPRPKRSAEHPTTKPTELIARCLRNSTPAGGIVLDCFAGSGSTAVAAHQLGRICYAMDIDGRYVDVAVRRLAAFTGLAAERRPA